MTLSKCNKYKFKIFIGELLFWLFSTKPRKIVLATCGECKINLTTRRIFRFICKKIIL